MKFTSDSVEETIRLGEKLGSRLTGGEFIALSGDLGGGKTHFAKGLAIGLGIKQEITSPTFVLERIYESSNGLFFHHFDFYRLASFDQEIQSEIIDLLGDSKNIVAIEWATNVPSSIPGEYLQVNFEYIDDERREITFNTKGLGYDQLIEGLK
ncbi:MAG: tRNA (adenosine(37)-N6)-threonylcarbamoyltransferase complex ATPase subunit type 1 TsaE [bacterium]